MTRNLSQRAAQLRCEFDRTFTLPVAPREPEGEELIAIRAGKQELLIRMAQIAVVSLSKDIAPIPGAARGLLGIAAVNRAVVPVYGLAFALGDEEPSAARWLMLARTDAIAFAFDELRGRQPARADDTQTIFDLSSIIKGVAP